MEREKKFIGTVHMGFETQNEQGLGVQLEHSIMWILHSFILI